MIEIASLMDRLHDFTNRVYRAMWDRVRQFWNEERWVRVTDDERNVRFVGLNRPVTLQEKLGQLPPEQVQMAAQRLLLRPNDPRLGMVVDVENRVEEIEVDIVIEEVPDRVTLQGEAFEALLKYAQQGAIPPEVLIEADPGLPASKKEKLLEQLEQQRQQAMQQPNPEAQKMQMEMQRDQARLQLEGQKFQSEQQLRQAEMQIEMRRSEMQSRADASKLQLEERKLQIEAAKVGMDEQRLRLDQWEREAANQTSDIAASLSQAVQQVQAVMPQMQGLSQAMAQQLEMANRPKRIVRNANGDIEGVEIEGVGMRPAVRDETGNIMGLG
jgi:hypothetical protein